jgi:hypothetical protein
MKPAVDDVVGIGAAKARTMTEPATLCERMIDGEEPGLHIGAVSHRARGANAAASRVQTSGLQTPNSKLLIAQPPQSGGIVINGDLSRKRRSTLDGEGGPDRQRREFVRLSCSDAGNCCEPRRRMRLS